MDDHIIFVIRIFHPSSTDARPNADLVTGHPAAAFGPTGRTNWPDVICLPSVYIKFCQ